MMPFVMQTMKETHEVINDVPVVVLANGRSVSMSEITSCCAKEMPNGRVIGSITHGGLCCLTDISNFSSNYNGHIGIEDKTPVYCYTPTIAFFNSEKKCLEGVGVTPDIEVAFDDKLFKDTGQDNQLDRALEYIRTGK
jgi:carboxyl-terminal processing protease